MRRHLIAAAFALGITGGLSGGIAHADQRDPALDQLFVDLRNAQSAKEARPLEHAIATLWAQSGSDAVDYLMKSGLAALGRNDLESALAMFRGVTQIAPDFAEGWSKRATVYYLMDDARNAVAALEHVLALEPRQFDALYGLAEIFEDWGDKKRALAALNAALAIDPQIDGAAERLKSLQLDVHGRGI